MWTVVWFQSPPSILKDEVDFLSTLKNDSKKMDIWLLWLLREQVRIFFQRACNPWTSKMLQETSYLKMLVYGYPRGSRYHLQSFLFSSLYHMIIWYHRRIYCCKCSTSWFSSAWNKNQRAVFKGKEINLCSSISKKNLICDWQQRNDADTIVLDLWISSVWLTILCFCFRITLEDNIRCLLILNI